MPQAYIIDAVRTPRGIGKQGKGALAAMHPQHLAATCLKAIKDLSPREIAVFAPLIVMVLWMGVYPEPFLNIMHVSVANLLERIEVAQAGMQTATVLGR